MLASNSSQHLESQIHPKRNPRGFHHPMNRSSALVVVALAIWAELAVGIF
jgi:hypothetical protein